ncbi:MAG: ribonuclease Z [Candidatus Bipolaricaulota bacterium]|nr:MAG: ribonuclease Z [Candidatus Bipolaricaulota bacterium]
MLLDDRLLLGLPPSAVPEMYRQGKDPAKIGHIFISHLHADHYFGLPFLLLPYRVGILTRETPLQIVGPKGLADATAEVCRYAWPGIHRKGCLTDLPVVFTEIEERGEGEVGGLRFEAVYTNHFDMLSFGYKIYLGERTIAFTGDTGECEALDRFLEDVSLLITECTHSDPKETVSAGHLGVDSIRRFAAVLRPRGIPILATHLTSEPPPIEGVTAAQDGGHYEL